MSWIILEFYVLDMSTYEYLVMNGDRLFRVITKIEGNHSYTQLTVRMW